MVSGSFDFGTRDEAACAFAQDDGFYFGTNFRLGTLHANQRAAISLTRFPIRRRDGGCRSARRAGG